MRKATAMVYAGTLVALGVATWLPQLGMTGCASPASAAKADKIMVFYSNETENELYKCGCRSNQAGGLSRRATVLAQQEAYPELVVDAGNFSAKRAESPYDNYKQDYLVRIYDMMGYHAINAGPQEFLRGNAGLQALNESLGGRMVSANVVDKNGQLVLPPFRVVTIGGVKVGIIGLITEQFFPNNTEPDNVLATTDPMEAFAAQWDTLKRTSDLQVVLSQLRDDEVDLLTKTYPEIDLVVGGPGWHGSAGEAPQDKNGVPYAKVGNRGKFIGQVMLDIEPADRVVKVASYEGKTIMLGDDIPYNEAVEQVLEEFKENLRTGNAKTPDGKPVFQDRFDDHTEGAQFMYSGYLNCQTCHQEITAGWLRTRHAQAYQTLQSKGEQQNPECLECHVVGYGEPGGYAAKGNTYLLANVQCESCHGPSSDHADLAAKWRDGRVKEKPTDWKIQHVNTPKETCITCHNPDNDPHWVEGEWPYEAMKAQVGCSQWLPQTGVQPATGTVHGGAPATSPATGTTPAPPAGGQPQPPPASGGH